jgi:hypothetical protein
MHWAARAAGPSPGSVEVIHIGQAAPSFSQVLCVVWVPALGTRPSMQTMAPVHSDDPRWTAEISAA